MPGDLARRASRAKLSRVEGFVIQQESDGSRTRFELAGELDDAAARRIKSVDLDELAASGCHTLSFDLNALEFIDSSGIGTLVHLRNRATARGMVFEIGGVPQPIERTLVMAGLAELFGLDSNA